MTVTEMEYAPVAASNRAAATYLPLLSGAAVAAVAVTGLMSVFSNAGPTWTSIPAFLPDPSNGRVNGGSVQETITLRQTGSGDATRRTAWRSVLRELRQLRDLLAVDDEPARSVAERAVASAEYLYRSGLGVPEMSVEDDGEIDLVWVGPGSFASLSFAKDGNLVGYHAVAGRADVFRLDQAFSNSALASFEKRALGA